MKIRNTAYLLVAISLVISSGVFGQTQDEVHNVPFASDTQNMFGPSTNAFTINQSINLFEINWNETYGTGNAGIITILGQSFGAAVNGHVEGTVGMDFTLSGFSLGNVLVDYPINVTNTVTEDYLYDPGDTVRISTKYELLSGAKLETNYPEVGTAALDVYFQVGAGLSATICVFGCTTFPIIPDFNTGLVNVNIFTINPTIAEFMTISSGPNSFGPLATENGLPMSSGEMDPTGATPFGALGITIGFQLPNVIVDDNVDFTTGDISACGGGHMSYGPNAPVNGVGPEYLKLSLSIFDLLGNIPGPVGQVLGNLSGGPFSYGGANFSWNFLTVSVDLKIENKQCFDFTPKVYGKYVFPVPVDYTTTLPSGAAGPSGTSSIINIEIGGDIIYKYPCYYADLAIQPTYSIDGQIRNHTYDSVSISVQFTALGFSLNIPLVTITPQINVPEICLPVPYPCPSWSCAWCWCTSTVCTPAFSIPAVTFGPFGLTLDPLLDYTLDIADFKYDWYNEQWALEGFSEYSNTSYNFTMLADSVIDLSIASQTNVSCFGGANGTITSQMVQTTYDVATFNYDWSNGSSGANPIGLVAGTYALTLYDSHGCNYFAATTITEPSKVDVAAITQDVSCNGTANGTIEITASGGTEAGLYTYAWSTANGSGLVASAEDQFTLGAGTYNLTVTDDNSCTSVTSYTLTEPNVLGQSGAITHVDCKNNLTGDIQVSTFGGTPQYGFLWDTGETTEDLSGIAAGVHTLTITDTKGCQSIVDYTVTEPANELSLSVTSYVDVDCKGNFNGSINISTQGGNILGGYSYDWTNSSGILLPMQTESISNVGAETYTLVVTDSKGCQATITQTISEPIAVLTSTPIYTHILCFGASTGSVDPGINGGTTAYTYLWSNASSSPILSNVPAGSYDLTVTDAQGCSETYTYILTEPIAALGITLTGVDVLCFGANTGEVTSTVTGGTQPYNYLWTTGAETTADISGLPIGIYELTVTDDNGCIIIDDATLIQPNAPLALSTVVTDIDCYGNNNGAVDLTITGGTSPYIKTWWNSGSVVLSDTTEDITNQYADAYTVLITDGNGCTDSITSTIIEPASPLAISGIINHVNCFQLNDGAIDATVSGGTFPYTYSWSNAAITEDINNVLAGTYTLTATDLNICVESMDFTITEPSNALIVTTVTTDVSCNGELDGEIESTVEGGSAPYTYLWSNLASTQNIEAIGAGPYTVTITDDQGCIAFTGATVYEPTALVANFTVTDASCYGYDDGVIEMLISGGIAPYYFDWGNQNDILLNNPSEILDSLIAEDYFIRVRDDHGCLFEQIVTVGEPEPFVSTTVVTDPLCYDGNDGSIDVTIIGGTINYSSVWGHGPLTEDVNGLTTGTYTYSVTDAQGCVINDTVFVDEPKLIQITYDITPISCIDQVDADIFIAPYGGTQPYTYLWSTGSFNQNAEDLPPGIYDLIITDDNLCSVPFSFEISINPDECLNIPNTFTPNGDNYNDTWVILNLDLYPNAVVKVFNKWGNEIYETQVPYQEWDGTHHAAPLPSDVYYYIIILGNDEGNEYTGTITIIR